MDNNALKTLVAQGLAAMKAGGKVAAAATAEIQNDARNPNLKAALDKGNDTSKQWAQRIDQALQEAGGRGEQKNPVLEGLYEVSRMIRSQAPDDTSRDLGIIANGQLADSDGSRPPIPTRSRPAFRFDVGHHSEMKPATR